MRLWYFFWVLVSINAMSQKLVILDVKGIDFETENADNFPHSADQIRFHKDHLLFRNHIDRKIFVASTHGQIIRTMGQAGQGPEAFSSGITAFGTFRDDVFLLSRKRNYRLFTLSDGNFSDSFPVDFQTFCKGGIDTNSLAVSENHIIVPAHPKTGHLATAYDHHGQAIPFGEILFDKRDGKLLQMNPCLNEVLWVFGPNDLYGILRYQPIILRYDAKFKLVGSTTLSNPRLSQLMVKHDDLDTNRFSTLPGLFYDCRVVKNNLYLLGSKTLFSIDLDRMVISEVFAFRGVGKAFEDKEPNNRLNFFTFALASNGRDLFLGPGHSFNAELFVTQLPGPSQSTKKGVLK